MSKIKVFDLRWGRVSGYLPILKYFEGSYHRSHQIYPLILHAYPNSDMHVKTNLTILLPVMYTLTNLFY